MKFLILSERAKAEILEFMPSNNIIIELANLFQNFSDITRLKILTTLSICDMCVNDIASLLNINQTTVSHQLQILRSEGIVNFRREGKILIYYLQKKTINDVMLTAVNCL